MAVLKVWNGSEWVGIPGPINGGLNNVVEDLTPQLGGNLDLNDKLLADANGNEELEFGKTASAVNHVKITNAATGGSGDGPTIAAVGDDASMALHLTGKGFGWVETDQGLVVNGGIQPSGDIVMAATKTVDGRDVSVDGTKLNGIEPNANNYSHPNHTGDVTSTGDGATAIAAGAVAADELATAHKTFGGCFEVTNPAANDEFIIRFDGNAITFTKVWAETDVGTCDVQLHHQAPGSRDTTGTQIMTADLQGTTGGASTTSFADATVAAERFVTAKIKAVASSPTLATFFYTYTKD